MGTGLAPHTNQHSSSRVALGLGGNLGTPAQSFRRAVSALEKAGMRDIVTSPLYQTAPVDCVANTPPFTNAALTGTWPKTPKELLAACQDIEQCLGRPRSHSSRESRIVDLDILLFGDQVMQRPNLIVPHPRLAERLFALAPLADIAPTYPVPGTNKTVKELYDAFAGTAEGSEVQRFQDTW